MSSDGHWKFLFISYLGFEIPALTADEISVLKFHFN